MLFVVEKQKPELACGKKNRKESKRKHFFNDAS